MKRIAHCVAVLAVAWAAFAPAASRADEINLIFATMAPPASPTGQLILKPWARRVTEQSKGLLRIDPRDGFALANFANAYDRVLNDVIQIAWILHSVYGNQFRLSSVTHLPFESDDSAVASVALSRLYKTGLLAADYAETEPLVLAVLSQSRLHLVKEPRSIDDYAGLKIIAGGKIYSDEASRLGATPVTLTLGEMYDALQRGTADGALMGWAAFSSFKLAEVTSFHVEAPLGTTSSMIFMSKKKFAALPEAARTVLRANSGEAEARRLGVHLQHELATQREHARALANHKIVVPSEAQAERLKSRLASITTEWVANTPGGDKILKTYRELLRDAQRN
jgi:TRAP-type C4-dicarboxylate transport system substrate-binding protein